MFGKMISQTPMTTPEAEGYFGHRIWGTILNGDNTFVSTLRALINPRIPEGDTLCFTYSRSSWDKSSLENISPRDAMSSITCDFAVNAENNIHLHNFCNMDGGESNRAWMDIFEQKFESVYEGWHRVEKVTAFYRNVFHSLCFINPDIKSTIIFADLSTMSTPMDMRRMHYLQCGIFAFLPWYFDPSQGVSALEKELVNSLREKTEEHYLQCLAKIAEAYDFRTARIKTLLSGFETRYERIRADQIRNNIDSVIRHLHDLDQQYADYLKQKRDYEANLIGLEMKISSGSEESEIMDYFLTNRLLLLKDVSNSRMEFVVRAPLDFVDEEIAERYIDNNGSYFYRYASNTGPFTRENLRMLFTELFMTNRLKMQFCAAYRFRLEGSVEALGHYGDYGVDCADYTPNPHIDQYRCLGNYQRIINERLNEQDYIGALEQCIASCKSLNLADSAVMEELIRRIVGRSDNNVNMKCIVLPDGKIVKPEKAIEWLLNEKQEKEAAEAQMVEEAVENGEDH
jgi:hypothetical protein